MTCGQRGWASVVHHLLQRMHLVAVDDWDDNMPLAEAGRVRRRLTKGGARVGDAIESGTVSEGAVLNSPVSERACFYSL